jgi:hypothetical protein
MRTFIMSSFSCFSFFRRPLVTAVILCTSFLVLSGCVVPGYPYNGYAPSGAAVVAAPGYPYPYVYAQAPALIAPTIYTGWGNGYWYGNRFWPYRPGCAFYGGRYYGGYRGYYWRRGYGYWRGY